MDEAKQWHIKVLLGGTLLYVIQISAVIMSVNGLNWIFLNISTINTNELIIALLVLNFLGCWLLALWLGMLALKLCLRNKNEEKIYRTTIGYGIDCNIELYAVVPILSADIIIQYVPTR